jgi:hypothetical protein
LAKLKEKSFYLANLVEIFLKNPFEVLEGDFFWGGQMVKFCKNKINK